MLVWQDSAYLLFMIRLLIVQKEGLYGDYILKQYAKEEIDELQSYLKDERDELFTYSGLELVMKRYLLISHNHEVLETPQEMFMGIAMHLAIKEQDRVYWAKQIYDILSMLKVTMATQPCPMPENHTISYPAVSLILLMIPYPIFINQLIILHRYQNMAVEWVCILEKFVPMEVIFAVLKELPVELFAGLNLLMIPQLLSIS